MVEKLGLLGVILLAEAKYEDNKRNKKINSILDKLLKENEYSKIIDVGCGKGRIGSLLRCKSDNIIGIDVDYNIKPKNKIYYDDFIYADLSKAPEVLYNINGDLYILYDVIEHLTKCQGRRLIKHIPDNSDIFLSTPKKLSNAHMIVRKNKFYIHKSVWTKEELSDFGFNKFHEIEESQVLKHVYDKHIIAIRS